MLIIISAIVAAFGIMVVLGSSVLDSEHNKRHPPDDDGISEVKDRDE